MGMLVGKTFGPLDGEILGLIVGTSECCTDGESLGVTVFTLGLTEGKLVGNTLGTLD